MKEAKEKAKSDAITRISALSFSSFKHLLIFILMINIALALVSASDIHDVRYINAVSGSQLVLNRGTNVTNGLNASEEVEFVDD